MRNLAAWLTSLLKREEAAQQEKPPPRGKPDWAVWSDGYFLTVTLMLLLMLRSFLPSLNVPVTFIA